MSEHQIKPEKITKPIQLLAAWLLGLVTIDGSFLISAAHLSNPEWLAPILVIAAVLNVPLFLFALFLLQTKFRPQMQEDVYYARYLTEEREYSRAQAKHLSIISNEKIEAEIKLTTEKIIKELGVTDKAKQAPLSAG